MAFSIGCTTEGAPSVVEDYVVLHPLHSCDEVSPQQHQQAVAGGVGDGQWPTPLRKGRIQACPPGSAPTTDAAVFTQGTCQGRCTSPTELVVSKVQPLDIGIGV